ncbi:hypothetical protein GDO78_012858 [Eleutherodactylus coqui]|uniref:Uncharacterized protein n=1 Tax=Eleutherodactylus coqui TaxID=57060 RepID=A0A8J6K3C6_ELECQ|nr:hypothetical protein GDO78_012858 [Eleutherodactylus coqui]
MATKLMSLNANGLNSPYKRSSVWREACRLGADIVCIQETHLVDTDSHRMTHKKFPQVIQACAQKKHAGVLIAFRGTAPLKID